jgi:hypothetical protein
MIFSLKIARRCTGEGAQRVSHKTCLLTAVEPP